MLKRGVVIFCFILSLFFASASTDFNLLPDWDGEGFDVNFSDDHLATDLSLEELIEIPSLEEIELTEEDYITLIEETEEKVEYLPYKIKDGKKYYVIWGYEIRSDYFYTIAVAVGLVVLIIFFYFVAFIIKRFKSDN
jgi:hypothetical protein